MDNFIIFVSRIFCKYLGGFFLNKFHERLKELRKLNNLTQLQLANKLNVYQSRITKWENGQHEPNIEMLIKLADALNSTIDYLVGYTDQK